MSKPQINWHSHPLNLDTVITRSYKTTQNVRRFFVSQLNREIKFNRDMFAWLHDEANLGKTMAEAIEVYKSKNNIT